MVATRRIARTMGALSSEKAIDQAASCTFIALLQRRNIRFARL
jgi:hypothetical protein